MKDSGASANRLAGETSPYLLQHAHNPVDWYPWGEEAFARARGEDRPILLSVGYSACHWCHVMERESFEDPETARLMNEGFVNVKVDREERPDVDALYMSAVQQMTGRGGWPMTVFLTPEGAPFYGGTYFPPEPRPGMPSFRQVLGAIAAAYRDRRGEVEGSARELQTAIGQAMALRAPPTPLEPGILETARRALLARFDERDGGFGGAPKFPQPMVLEFLLREWRRTGDEAALRAVEHTLTAMARGGIHDHLGGGFHRYSVDARWLVPHFEKMLYDNALLARAYLHAWQATGRVDFRAVAVDVLDYVLREMTAPGGGFHSSQDADSEGEEGRFYLWTAAEIDERLGPGDGPLFRAWYGVEEAGNFRPEVPGEAADGRNILHVARSAEAVAEAAGVPVRRLEEALARGREILYEARSRRVPPGRDDKVITSWNAMMLRSLADAARILDRADYREAARRNASFLLRELRGADGGLLRSWRGGRAKIDAFLEDHALLVDALVSLYQADFDPGWIREARALADRTVERFWSAEEGVFYDTPRGGEALVVRPREVSDNATPSGTSAAVVALLRLAALTGEATYEGVAVGAMESVAGLLPRFPQGFGEMLSALDLFLGGSREVAIAGRAGAPDTGALLDVLRRHYLPDTVLALRDPESADAARVIPLLEGREMRDGRATAYVCRHFACRAPVTDPEALEAELLAEGA